MKTNQNHPSSSNSPFAHLSDIDLNFTIPDIRKLKLERQARNSSILNGIDVSLARNFSDRSVAEELSHEDEAAIRIQKFFRGYLGRKHYLNVLYESVVAGEEELQLQQQSQVQEGEILIENYKIENETHDTDTIDRNKSRLLNASAITIQRLWREKRNLKQRGHICCPCNDDYPDLYEYYQVTESICFCCEQHRLHGYSEEVELSRNIPLFDENLDSIENKNINSSSLTSDSEFLDNRDNILPSDQLNNQDNALITSITFTDVSNYTDDSGPRAISALNLVSRYDAQLGSADKYEEKLISSHDVKIHDPGENVDLSYNIKEIPEEGCSSMSKINVLKNMSLEQLKELIEKLECDICGKNAELLEELTTRDQLHSQHETLLMEVDILVKGLKR